MPRLRCVLARVGGWQTAGKSDATKLAFHVVLPHPGSMSSDVHIQLGKAVSRS